MGFKKALYEHLITKKKYNTLLLKYEVAREDLEKKQIELNTQKRINLKEKEIWEQRLKELQEEIIELKKKGVKKNVRNTNKSSAKVSRKKQNNK
jgi:hypothetical protein